MTKIRIFSFLTDIKFYEKHAMKIVVGLAITIVVLIMVFKLRQTNGDSQNKTESEKQIDKLEELVWRFLDKTDKYEKNWLVIKQLDAAVNSDYYGGLAIYLDFLHSAMPDGGTIMTSTKIQIPSPKIYAVKDAQHGLPISFHYKFIFDKQDSITSKFIVVEYDKDTAVDYDIDFNPVQKLLNRKLVADKINSWQEKIKTLTKQEIQKEKKYQQKQNETRNKNCKEEKELITNVYKMLTNSLAELEYQYQYSSDEDFGLYVAQWNRNAKVIREQYSIKSFDCFFAFDYNHILGDYQSAGLEMAYISMGSSPDNYIFFKSRMKKYYRYLMDSYKNKK